MPTNLDLDDKLIEEAKKAGRHRSKKDAVTAALKEYVLSRRRTDILKWVGKVDFWPDYDHKDLRHRKGR